MTDKVQLYFSSTSKKTWSRILIFSLFFHFFLVLAVFLLNKITFSESEQLMIPVFEMVQVAPNPPPPQKQKSVQKPEPKPLPEPEPPKPIKKELPPEPKIVEEPTPVESPPEPEAPVEEDFAMDDLDLASVELPSLEAVGAVNIDPLMQIYLERLKQIIMQNFNPPSNFDISRSAKTTVAFTVNKMGQIYAISLKHSSKNKTWDHLSMRAVQVSKLPALPETYKNNALSLQFNFTPN